MIKNIVLFLVIFVCYAIIFAIFQTFLFQSLEGCTLKHFAVLWYTDAFCWYFVSCNSCVDFDPGKCYGPVVINEDFQLMPDLFY